MKGRFWSLGARSWDGAGAIVRGVWRNQLYREKLASLLAGIN